MNKRDLYKALLRSNSEVITRTTATISADAEEALKWLTSEHQIAFKDVVCIMREKSTGADGELMTDSCLAEVVQSVSSQTADSNRPHIRKTLSMERDSLEYLKTLAKTHNIRRDDLITHILLYARRCVLEVSSEIARERRQRLAEIRNWIRKGQALSDEINSELPEDELAVLFDQAVSKLNLQFPTGDNVKENSERGELVIPRRGLIRSRGNL